MSDKFYSMQKEVLSQSRETPPSPEIVVQTAEAVSVSTVGYPQPVDEGDLFFVVARYYYGGNDWGQTSIPSCLRNALPVTSEEKARELCSSLSVRWKFRRIIRIRPMEDLR